MSRSLTLSWASSHYRDGRDDGVRIRVEVTCASGISDKIFAYRMLPMDADGNTEAVFSHICSAVDLAEYPEDEARVGDSPEWLRRNSVDVLVRSVTEALNFINVVKSDVQRTIASLNNMDTLTDSAELVIGEPCDTEPSESASDSSSSSVSVGYGGEKTYTAMAASEYTVGLGVDWYTVGTGAGSPVGSSDSGGVNYSGVTICAGEASKLLLSQSFDFSAVPVDAMVTGIEVSLWARNSEATGSSSSEGSSSSAAAECARIGYLTLQHPDLGVSEDKSDDECVDSPAWELFQFGGSDDLWGYDAITGEHLHDGAFGVGLVITNAFHFPQSSVEIDGIRVTVHYREVL